MNPFSCRLAASNFLAAIGFFAILILLPSHVAAQSVTNLSGSNNMVIANGTTLSNTETSNTIYSGSLSGFGSFENSGTEGDILTLSGANSYVGTTTIESATLSIASSANIGSGSIILGSLNSNYCPSGAYLCNKLQISDNSTIGQNIQVAQSGGVIDTLGNTVTLSGNVSGYGQLEKDGLGIVILSGNNINSPNISIASGMVQGNTQSIQSGVYTETATSSVLFNQTFDGTYLRLIDGSGTFTKTGPWYINFRRPDIF